ncbi:MAG: type II secretion system F family protein [Paracoccaceae bacterium]
MEFLGPINDMIVGALGPAGPLLVIGFQGALMILLVLPLLLSKKSDPFDKVKDQRKKGAEPAPGQAATLRREEKTDKLEKYAHFLEPQDKESLSAARLKLLRAGYTAKNAVRVFHFAQLTLGLGLLGLGAVYALLMSATQEMSVQFMAIVTIGPGAAGYYLPQYWVQRRLEARRTEIIEGFPDSLDLMLVCVEAGQSLDQSISRVAKESRAGYPALADEFDMVANEVKAGKERAQVLKDMSLRVGIPDVSSFVTTLVQSATYGTSIAEALRIYSAEMRDKRVMRAEEKANTLPTKLTLGTMLFTLPPLLIILIGPSIHGVVTHIGGGG